MELLEMLDLLRRINLRDYPFYQSEYFKERMKWLESNRKHPVVVFYNTGKHLFMQESDHSADSVFYLPWKWVRYKDFSEGNVFFKQEKCNGNNGSRGLVGLKHHGHGYNRTVGLGFSSARDLSFKPYAQKRLKAGHLYFVSIKNGRIWRALDQEQHLPSNPFEINSNELKPISI